MTNNAQANNLKNLIILGFTLFTVMIGFGMIMPILPFYIKSMGASGKALGLLVASYAVTRLICGPIWGSLSDRWGRKPVLLVGVLGYAITMILFGLATQLWMLFVIRSLSGILSSATSPTTMAYISDSTTKKDRSGGIGVLGAAIGLGTIIGPGLGGLFSGPRFGNSLSLPFFIGGGLAIVSLLLIILFLPESLPGEARRAPDESRMFPLRKAWGALYSPIGILLVLALIMSFALNNFTGIFGLYAAQRYQYGTQEVGTILVVIGVVSAIAQGLLTGPLNRRFGEPVIIRYAMMGTAIGFVLMIFANSTLTLLFSTGFFTLATGLLSPSLTALTSRRSTLEQGLAMGLNDSFISIGRILGPACGGFLFDLNINLPYLCGALVMLGGFGLAVGKLESREIIAKKGVQPG